MFAETLPLLETLDMEANRIECAADALVNNLLYALRPGVEMPGQGALGSMDIIKTAISRLTWRRH